MLKGRSVRCVCVCVVNVPVCVHVLGRERGMREERGRRGARQLNDTQTPAHTYLHTHTHPPINPAKYMYIHTHTERDVWSSIGLRDHLHGL